MSALPLVLLGCLPSQFADPGAAVERPAPYEITAETPLERLDAALRMIRVDRPDVARRQLVALLEGQPRREELIELRDAYGSGTLLSLARNEAVQPEGQLLLDAVAAAVNAEDNDPASIDRLLAALVAGGDAAERALVDARRRGRPLAIELFNRAAAADPTTAVAVQGGLRAIGEGGIDPALTAAGDPALEPFVISSLQGVRQTDRIVDLVRLEADPMFAGTGVAAVASDVLDRQNVALLRVDPARTLRREAIKLLRGEQMPNDPDGRLRLDADTQTLVPAALSVTESRLADATQYAAAAARIAPGDREAVTLAQLLAMESDPDSSADPIRALVAAVDLNLPQLAVAAIQKIDSPAALSSDSPLTAALNHPSRSVQLAAAIRAAALDPGTPFAGSHRVAEILIANLAAGAARQVVVIDPNTVRGNATGGKFAQLNFRPSVVRTGREGVAAAAANPATELVVIDPNSIRNPLSTTLAELAADIRTREIPVVILTGPGLVARSEVAARNHPQAIVALDSEDVTYLRKQVAEVFLPDTNRPGNRSQQAAAALAEVAVRNETGIDLQPLTGDIVAALESRGRDDRQTSADILSALGTPDARRLLLSLTDGASADESSAIRRAAHRQAERFATFARSK